MIRGDKTSVSVSVEVPPALAFEIFTSEIDLWWRRGPAYRVAGRSPGTMHLECALGGRVFESWQTAAGPHAFEIGKITAWEPPARFAFEWRTSNFAPGEVTFVEVRFQPSASGTLVSVEHRGFAALRPDHPVRHGKQPPEFIGMMGRWWGALMTALREHAAGRRDG